MGGRVNFRTSDKTDLEYAIALQRAIEYRCRGQVVPDSIAKDCPHHAEMLDANLRQSKLLQSMVEHGLGLEDMENDI